MALNYTTEKLGELANSTSYVEFMQGVNTSLMGGWYGSLILIAVTAIMFIAFMQTTDNPRKSIAATLVLSFLLALLLRTLELVPDLAIVLTLVGAAASVAFATRD